MEKIGKLSFVLGLIGVIAITLIAAKSVPNWAVLAIMILGVIVGILNITTEEAVPFLVASIAFMVACQIVVAILIQQNLNIAPRLYPGALPQMMSLYVASAAVIVSVKIMYQKAKDK
jgi:hypothetical protein